jgi:hypothetical protein
MTTVGAQPEIVERRERLRREVAVTRCPEDSDTLQVGGEPADERGLADAGFSAHGDEAPRAGYRCSEVLVEVGELRRRSTSVMPRCRALFRYRVCGKPRSTLLVAGSGQRDVTTLPRV